MREMENFYFFYPFWSQSENETIMSVTPQVRLFDWEDILFDYNKKNPS